MYSYLASGDVTYLARAELQAQRLIDTAVISRNAMYFPYPFDFKRHGVTADTMVAPWYSAMAQGQALTLFVRLHEITANAAYLTAAASTFNSFLNLKAPGVPWTVFIDGTGHLWFEEYAKDPRVPDRTYNGQTFAIYGVWDYYRLTQSADALQLLRGGLTTVAHYFPGIRAPGWISRYCAQHGVQDPFYHQAVLRQLLKLYTMTGAVEFARYSDLLYADYPYPKINGTVRFSGGTHTGYKFNASGAVIAARTTTLSRVSSAPYGLRQRIKGRSGYYFLITAGVWAGYWIPETPGRSYARGELSSSLAQNYDPARIVFFSAGTYTGYTFDAAGNVTGSRTATLGKVSSAAANRQVVINGRRYVAITNGIWGGMYVQLGPGVTL
jgi:hypothetical protein